VAELHEPFVLHPSILISALLPSLPNSARANRLLGDVSMGRRQAYAVGGGGLLELYTVDAVITSGHLGQPTTEDLANFLHDLRLRLRELNLADRFHTEDHQSYLLAAMSLSAQFRIDMHSALTVAAANIHERPLILDDADLYDRLRPAAVRPGLQIMRLSDFP
jgi:hypothetical protein